MLTSGHSATTWSAECSTTGEVDILTDTCYVCKERVTDVL